MILRFALFLSLIIISGVTPTRAKFYKSCEQAEHTADMVSCLSTRNEKAQDHLNETFLKVLDQSQDDAVRTEELRDIQKDWIIYRDKECQHQVGAQETTSLKRVQELKCLESLTTQRIGVLESSLVEEGEDDQNMLPLWMNALSSDYPSVFWDYGNRVRMDLNCDGVGEYAMLGLKSGGADDVESVLAVVSTPETGRAETNFWSFETNLGEGESAQKQSCTAPLTMKTVPYPKAKPEVENVTHDHMASCISTLNVTDRACGLWALSNGEEGYTLTFMK